MRRTLLAGVALMLMSAPAFAQTTTITTTGIAPSPGAHVVIAPELRPRIKSYVVEQRVRPVRIQERVAVGTLLPTDVELHAVPSDWGPSLNSYRYVYSGDDVVLVEPSTRRVIQVID